MSIAKIVWTKIDEAPDLLHIHCYQL